MFDFEIESHSRHTPEPDLVPILDALTSVIFFLLLSTTFMELTKLTVPPSQTSVITDPVIPPPLAAKMMVAATKDNKLHVILKWGGAKPDLLEARIPRMAENARSEEFQKEVERIVTEFSTKFPEEKTISLGMGKGTTYQEMITAMDGVREKLQDIVLFSNEEVDALVRN